MSDETRESWTTAERYIAESIDEIKAELKDHRDKLYTINGEVSGLRVRASIFGIFGGFAAALLALLTTAVERFAKA